MRVDVISTGSHMCERREWSIGMCIGRAVVFSTIFVREVYTNLDHRKNELSNEFEFYGDLRVVSASWRLNFSSEDKSNDSPGV